MQYHSLFLLIILAILISKAQSNSIKTATSYGQIGKIHCDGFPVQLLYRLATGQLAEAYGKEFAEIDCYIRQFVNKDGQDAFQIQQEDEEENQDQAENQQEQIPTNDPIVEEYAKGLSCLPQEVDKVDAVYSIWRFYRFVIQHDYAYQWMRAKIRASLGYSAEKPNAWMDGQQSAARLRLDKLYSNQFYEYVDTLMFKDFLHPLMTFLKRNTVLAASGAITQSGKPILVQVIQNKNLLEKIFEPIIFKSKQSDIFAYTIPGVPLLLSGSNSQVSWAFTGVLVDRSNIQQIQTLGNKFYHHDSETWIKLQNITFQIKVKESEQHICKFVHSNYGTLYEKHRGEGGKVSQYIARWHENQKKVRVLFSNLHELISNKGVTTKNLQFPFSSLIITNESGIYQYVCPQKHPSYFLYPDLASQPEQTKNRWISGFKKNFVVVHNTHLTTHKEESYFKKQVHNPVQEQILIDLRRKIGNGDTKNKFTLQSLLQFVSSQDTDTLIKKRKQHIIYIYRKAKFLFFPQQAIRKQCDQVISMLQRWDNHLSNPSYSPAFILWDYFIRQYTFNYASSSDLGKALAKHRALTDSYWTVQIQNWKAGVSYGECDSAEWETDYRQRLNGTGENSTCFLNVMKGINRTREILRQLPQGLQQPKLNHFDDRRLLDISKGYLGSHVEQAFGNLYSKNLQFSAQIGNKKIIYTQGYKQIRKQVDLSNVSQVSTKQQIKQQTRQQNSAQQTQL